VIGAGAGAGAFALLDSGSSTTIVRQVGSGSATTSPTAASGSLSVGDVYRHTSKGVVEIIQTSSGQASPFPGNGSGTQQAQGSGFVYDEQGHIVTNDHVVDGADSITVKLWNGSTYDATVVGADPSTDLAVLKIDAPTSVLHPIALADSDAVQVGDGVVAIGSPFGLPETVTSGIVSALHRQMTSPNNFTIDDSIQTDAAINHGNSGGPLLDLQAKVIGVNSQIQSESGGNDGVGFAVPSNTVRSIVSQIVSGGKIEHAYLGVAVQTIPESAAGSLGLAAGAEVTTVRDGTPAAKAGLKAAGSGTKIVDNESYAVGGDVITAVDGTTITSSDQLSNLIAGKSPGDTVKVTYVRDGKSHTVSVTLTSRPS